MHLRWKNKQAFVWVCLENENNFQLLIFIGGRKKKTLCKSIVKNVFATTLIIFFLRTSLLIRNKHLTTYSFVLFREKKELRRDDIEVQQLNNQKLAVEKFLFFFELMQNKYLSTNLELEVPPSKQAQKT